MPRSFQAETSVGTCDDDGLSAEVGGGIWQFCEKLTFQECEEEAHGGVWTG